MRLTNNQLQFILNSDVEELVAMLSEDNDMPIAEAFSVVYNSKTYEKLVDTKTGLYLQSPEYQYEYLKEEIGKH